MVSLVVPLWAIQHLAATPIWVGIAVGARSFLPLLFSIHGGALMDRLGTRRVMAACAVITLILFPFYVIWGSMLGLILLQMVIGLSPPTLVADFLTNWTTTAICGGPPTQLPVAGLQGLCQSRACAADMERGHSCASARLSVKSDSRSFRRGCHPPPATS